MATMMNGKTSFLNSSENLLAKPPKVVWEPIKGTSQEFALDSRAQHTLYHGARGPGKTATQLMFFRRYVGLGYGSYWRGIIFDREFKNLADLVTQSKRFFYAFEDGAKFHASGSDYKWVWPTGEELLLRHAKKESDYDQFHGHEYPFIGWNELTKHPSSALYLKMMSCNRSSFTPERDTPFSDEKDENDNPIYDTPDGLPLPPIPLKVFATTNPSGPGHGWVKRMFIDPAKNGELQRKTVRVYDPQSKQDVDVIKTQVAIFGSWRENIFLTAEYIAELTSITDENRKRAWLKGDWDVVAGGALDDLWKTSLHVIPRFKIPATWVIDRSMDWGSSHPFSVGWWAEANGEEAELIIRGERRWFAPPAGTLIQIDELYGSKELGSNEGLKMSAPDIADLINEREQELLKSRWIVQKPWPGPADNQIRDVRESDVDTIEKKMGDKNVRWTHSDKSPGSRKIGLQLIRDRLQASSKNEGPGIYFMQNCLASIATIPVLPRDDLKIDDVDTSAEDHAYDMTRYRVLKGANRGATNIEVGFAH